MASTRRRLLTTTASAAVFGALGGCLGGGADAETGPEGPTARASFFVFGDLTDRVAGDDADAELLVPIGQHGHGWEPGPRVREEIRRADLFVHGMEGFQPWVDDVGRNLAADDPAVTTVNASDGVDLLEAGASHDHDDETYAEDEHDYEKGSHTEEAHDHEEGTHADGDDHGGSVDPHFCMDPRRVTSAVENVRGGLVAVDEGNAEAYADRADAVQDRLDDLHARIESTVADASNDTVLVAGHDAFRYFADRYDVEVVALTDASPDDRPTPRDVERARRLVDERGLQYVCADPLESQRAAEELVAETDAEALLPLTAMPGLTDEWEAEGWGYVEVMENVNLPTLERALDAA